MNEAYNIYLNIDIGVWYFSILQNYTSSISNDWVDVYGAYNVGLGSYLNNYKQMHKGMYNGKPYGAMKRFSRYLEDSYTRFNSVQQIINYMK